MEFNWQLIFFQREPVVSTSWQSALQADSARSSHPISVKVQRPEEIDDIFDTISYQKVRKPLHSGSDFLTRLFLLGWCNNFWEMGVVVFDLLN